MATVTRRPLAQDDLLEIWGYIGADSGRFADAMLDRIEAKLTQLATNPHLGRPRSELLPNLRSLAVGNYVLFYEPSNDGITLIRVLHGARDIPRLLHDTPDKP